MKRKREREELRILQGLRRQKGKGGKSKGKGMEREGKGFGGECWTCGEKGHRSNECPNKEGAAEIGSVEEAARERSVGGVWAIAQVKANPEYEGQVVWCRRWGLGRGWGQAKLQWIAQPRNPYVQRIGARRTRRRSRRSG